MDRFFKDSGRMLFGGRMFPSARVGAFDDSDVEVYRDVDINAAASNEAREFCSNLVTTRKYNAFTFLPVFLLESFRKLANAYFLMVALLQCIKQISNTNGLPTVMPVVIFILAVDAVFVLMEDSSRRKADKIANSARTQKLDAQGAFAQITWKDVIVGDIVKVCNREAIPADLLIVAVSEPSGAKAEGICYVETKSLDGETNLKLRQGIPELFNRVASPDDLKTIRGAVKCEQPNNALERFTGTVQVTGGSTSAVPEGADEKVLISPKNILLRGCNLRNTDYIYGLVVNTGMDTKVFQSASQTPSKRSTMDRNINKQITWLVLVLVLLCATGATFSTLENDDIGNHWAMRTDPTGRAQNWVTMFFYYFLLMYQDIPISLYVTMTMVKFVQAYFMMQDLEMYHPASDRACKVRSMSLNDELGLISHVFTDKTGTLTQNMMTFVRCSISGKFYGKNEVVTKATTKVAATPALAHPFQFSSPFVEIEDPAIFADLAGGSGKEQEEACASFFTALAICHTVIIEKTKEGEPPKYSASSPDENALVAAAAFAGFEFVERRPGYVKVGRRTEAKGEFAEEYKMMQTLQFNSKRKMMSTIVQPISANGDTQDSSGKPKIGDYVIVISKGADNVITEKLASSSRNSQHFDQTLVIVDEDAKQGYRTLFIAQRKVPLAEYEEWQVKYHAACTNLEEIEKKNKGLPNSIDDLADVMEKELTLVGSTALEDKLQDGVPNTIASLKKGGTSVWVLTGDKMETATNIGYACSVLDKSVHRIDISGDRIVENLKDSMREGEEVVDAAAAIAAQESIMEILTETITSQINDNLTLVNSNDSQAKGQ
jgi:phospholipid-translocating P-type ATPase (flippase)